MAITEQQFAEHVTWALCESSSGAGPDRCDPEHCTCGAEGCSVARIIYRNGYVLTALRSHHINAAAPSPEKDAEV